MDVEKILLVDEEYFISRDALALAENKIEIFYSKNAGGEKLVVPGNEETSKFEVAFSKGDGIIVLERNEVEDASGKRTVQGLKVTFRKQGDIRIDDPNQDPIVSGGIFHTIYAVCNQKGEITFFSSNEKQSNPDHLHRLLNKNLPRGQRNWPGFDKRKITDKYKMAVSSAIGVLKKLP